MRIENFKSQLLQGGARPNHFEVIINSPSLAALGIRNTYLVKAASLPASSVTDIPVMYRGREIHLVGERTFAPWTVTVINEVNFNLRYAFEVWHNNMQYYSNTSAVTGPLLYKTDLIVNQIDRNLGAVATNAQPGNDLDTLPYGYKFFGAYPIEVGEIGLSYDINNAIEEFPVTFVFDYFVPGDKSGYLS